ncbi:MAG: hypothetical protein J7485_11410 [Sphingobium sp.]|nr:hypothetical protein [Sphingobium sp.]
MRVFLALAAASFISPAAPASAAAVPPMAPLIVPPDGAVQVTVNGQKSRMLLLGDGSSIPVFNAAAAQQFGFKPAWISFSIRIATVKIKGWTAVVRYDVNGQPYRRRTVWFEREIAPGFAGMLGPGAAPQNVVTVQIRPPAANERPFVLPLVENRVLGVGTMSGKIFVQFDPLRRQTMGTAAAGALLAESQGGALTGATRPAPIRFGVERPVRTLAFARPLKLGPIELRSVAIRVFDYGSIAKIPDADADPEEIVAIGKKKKDPDYRSLHIAADALAGCSSITFDKLRKQIILSCQA